MLIHIVKQDDMVEIAGSSKNSSSPYGLYNRHHIVLFRHRRRRTFSAVLSAFILNFLWLCIGVPIIISVFIWRSHHSLHPSSCSHLLLAAYFAVATWAIYSHLIKDESSCGDCSVATIFSIFLFTLPHPLYPCPEYLCLAIAKPFSSIWPAEVLMPGSRSVAIDWSAVIILQRHNLVVNSFLKFNMLMIP